MGVRDSASGFAGKPRRSVDVPQGHSVDFSGGEPPSARAIWIGFAMMCVGMFMAVLDVQIVATSLPTIQKALAIDPDAMSWIQTAYLTAEVIAIPLTGFLTRWLGMRWLFVVAVSAFTAASAGCAGGGSFDSLIVWRVLQGFFGGTLIPAVFSAVFLLFPFRSQGLATTLAGVLAVLAPTTGPIAGGWITETYSWHWLFLVNIVPGMLSAAGALAFLPRSGGDRSAIRVVDPGALFLMAGALAALEIGLKEAPQRGWQAPPVVILLCGSVVAAGAFVRRTLRSRHPLADLQTFRDRDFAAGSILSFACGIGLFGSVYLMPVFLGLVRDLGALEIGEIMLVTGVVQLATAPIAVALERRVDARILALAGFAGFGFGAAMSAVQTVDTGFDAMFWPQVVRGCASMFCLLAPTRLALGDLPPERVADASGLFNVMRNLGGAIGLALIDTVIFGRVPVLATDLMRRLSSGDVEAARIVGVPLALFTAQAGRPIDASTQALLGPMIRKAALTQSMNEAWALVASLILAAILALPLARSKRASEGASSTQIHP